MNNSLLQLFKTLALLVFFQLCIAETGNAQWIKTKAGTDRLYNKLNRLPFNKIPIDSLEYLITSCWVGGDTEGEDAALRLLRSVATELKSDSVWAYYYTKIGNARSVKNNDLIIKYVDSAFTYAKASKNVELIVVVCCMKSGIYGRLFKKKEQLEFALLALKYSEQADIIEFLPWRYFDVSNLYHELNDTLRNFEMARKSYLAAKRLNKKDVIANASLLYGGREKMRGDLKSALRLFNEAKDNFLALEDSQGVANCYRLKANVFMELKKPDSAIANINYGLKLYRREKSIYAQWGKAEKAEAFAMLHQYDSAIASMKSAIEIGDLSKPAKVEMYHRLAYFYSMQDDYKNAYKYMAEIKEFNNRLMTETQRKATEELAVKYETEKKDTEIKLLAKEKELQEREIKQQRLFNYATIGFAVLLILLFIIGYRNILLNRKTAAQLAEFEKQQRVLHERTRIASELHDDLGSGLTKISLMSQVAGSIAGDKQQQTLSKITTESSEMVDKMNGIIWALNTKNDSLPNLISFIRKHAFELFENSQINILWHAPEEFPDVDVSGEVRRNIYLVVKEALHNALKYSAATQVEIKIDFENGNLKMEITDNGKGFDYPPPRGGQGGAGNGLSNMKKRVEEIGGEIKIVSEINKGTKIIVLCTFA